MFDGDGSNDPAEIPRFVNALKEGADIAEGFRSLPWAGRSDISRRGECGNLWLNKVVNLIYGTRYTHLRYGYNAFRRDCLPVFELEAGEVDGADRDSVLWVMDSKSRP